MKRLTSALTILAVGMVMTSVATAQDVDAIKQATLEHFATLTAGNAAAHVAHHMPAVSSFGADGGLLSEAESREAQHMVLQADLDGGLRLNLELRHLKVNVYGDAAVVTGYVVGTATLSDGSTLPVNDRRTAVLIRHGGEWKEVHTHTSNLTTWQPGQAAQAQGVTTVTPEALSWQPVEGDPEVRMAVLYGNPAEAGHYIVRLKLPPSWAGRPHTHGDTELITIHSGMCYIAHGDALTREAAKKLSPGALMAMPAGTKMRAFTGEDGCVADVEGQGPLTTQYLDGQGN